MYRIARLKIFELLYQKKSSSWSERYNHVYDHIKKVIQASDNDIQIWSIVRKQGALIRKRWNSSGRKKERFQSLNCQWLAETVTFGTAISKVSGLYFCQHSFVIS